MLNKSTKEGNKIPRVRGKHESGETMPDNLDVADVSGDRPKNRLFPGCAKENIHDFTEGSNSTEMNTLCESKRDFESVIVLSSMTQHIMTSQLW